MPCVGHKDDESQALKLCCNNILRFWLGFRPMQVVLYDGRKLVEVVIVNLNWKLWTVYDTIIVGLQMVRITSLLIYHSIV